MIDTLTALPLRRIELTPLEVVHWRCCEHPDDPTHEVECHLRLFNHGPCDCEPEPPCRLEHKPCQRASSHHDGITAGKMYLMSNEDDKWFFGTAAEVWFGWQFWIGSHYKQLSHVKDLYEVDMGVLG